MSSNKRTRSSVNLTEENLSVLCSESEDSYRTLQKMIQRNRMSKRSSMFLQSPSVNTISSVSPPMTPIRMTVFDELEERSRRNDARSHLLREERRILHNQIEKHLIRTKTVLSNYF